MSSLLTIVMQKIKHQFDKVRILIAAAGLLVFAGVAEAEETDSHHSESPVLRMLTNLLPEPKLLMSEEEKAVAKLQSYIAYSLIMPVLEACQNDIANHCSEEEDPLACLIKKVDSAKVNSTEKCCASHIRNATGNTTLKSPTFHHDLIVPVGSKLEYDPSCAQSKVHLNKESLYQNIRLTSGTVFFDRAGNVELGQLLGNVTWRGLDLAEQQPPTRISQNGTPEFIRLSKPGKYYDFELAPMQLDIPNSLESANWDNASFNDLYLRVQASQLTRDPGTTKLHPNGGLARGKLAEAHTVNGVPLTAGIALFSAQGHVTEGVIAKDIEYGADRIPLAAGKVTFSDDGQILNAKLTKTHQWQHLTLAAGEIGFHPNGNLKQASLAAGSAWYNTSLPAKAKVTFNVNGTPETLMFVDDHQTMISSESHSFKLGDLIVKANWPYQVFETGQPKEVRFFTHTSYRGKIYPKQTELRFDPDGEVIWDSFYHGVMQNNDKKEAGTLPEILPFSQVRQGLFFPKGSIVYSNRSGSVKQAILSSPVKYKNFILAADEVKFDNRRSQLWQAKLHQDQTVDSLRFKGRPKSVMFDEKGEVAHAFLAGDQNIRGVWLADESSLNLFPDQTLQQGTLARDQMVAGLPLKSDTKVEFYKDGRVKSGFLSQDHTIDNFAYAAGSKLTIYKNSKDNSQSETLAGTLAHDQTWRDILIPASTEIRTTNGLILALELDRETDVQGYTLDGRKIGFHDNGQLRTGVLAKDTLIADNTLRAGTQLLFDPDGNLLGSDFVGIIKPKGKRPVNSGDNSAVVIIASPEVAKLDAPPSKKICEFYQQQVGTGNGYSLGSSPTSQFRKCRAFYAEFRE